MRPGLRALYHGSAIYHLSLSARAPRELALKLDPWPGDPAQGEALLAGEFRFQSEAVRAPSPPWRAGTSEAWRAQLHGFHWLADLAALGSEPAWETARRWTADWIAHFDIYDRLAWRADIIGDRLFAWLEHFDRLSVDVALGQAMRRSLARQSRHLARVAHREAPGLPRLAALRGLIAALAAQALDRALAHALQHFAGETEAQILPDGGHITRNPETQLAALRYLVDARAALAASHNEIHGAIQQAIDRAAPMLRFFRHGDGRLALFNGANEGDGTAIDRVLNRADAKGRAPATAPHCGYERLRAGHALVVFDCGKPPPAGCDADFHAGALAFEMSYGRERLIVNCGAYHGPSAEWRGALRATAAHSTLIAADTSSVEFRADGSVAAGPQEVTAMRAEDAGAQWVAASHDGYKKALGLTHARQLFLAADGEDLRGEDRLTGRAGQGFAIRFHLHPNVQASLTQDGNAVLLRLPGGIGWRLRMQGAVLSIGESIYVGAGSTKKTRQVVLDGHVGSNGAIVKWALRREAKKPAENPEPSLPDQTAEP
ncbi:MAG TPA: heparinase II/III family protein [Stellaceae bacterium]|nr:heparinase II/III family protein [Stellaceae bacterium]